MTNIPYSTAFFARIQNVLGVDARNLRTLAIFIGSARGAEENSRPGKGPYFDRLASFINGKTWKQFPKRGKSSKLAQP